MSDGFPVRCTDEETWRAEVEAWQERKGPRAEQWDEGGRRYYVDQHNWRNYAPTMTAAAVGWPDAVSSNGHAADVADQGPLFRTYGIAELLAMPRDFHWLMRGVLVEPTYGQTAGEGKTLKTHVSTFVNLSLAAGIPLFGKFAVDEAVPVLVYVGEGGRAPHTRLLERVARAMSVDLASLPLKVSYDVAPFGSVMFRESLARDFADHRPRYLNVDPMYAFHGAKTNAASLHEEGALLTGIQQMCADAGTSLMVNNHFNQTGGGFNLNRITMAGGAEWVDSWILLEHRQPPDVAAGRFWLRLAIGSRQWGGSDWDLDLELGRFDPDLGEFLGDIVWRIDRHKVVQTPETAITELLGAEPWTHTKDAVLTVVDGRKAAKKATFEELVEAGVIVAKRLPRTENGRTVHRDLWALVDEPVPTPERVAP